MPFNFLPGTASFSSPHSGTDIRCIQSMLGHEFLQSIQSTQIYTKLSVSKPKEVHTANHPAHETRQGVQ